MKSALWAATILLVTTGIIAAAGRAMFPRDFGQRMEPIRTNVMRSLHRVEPDPVRRQQLATGFESSYVVHPVVITMHVVFGGIFLALIPLQFSRYRRFHRWTGRLLLVCGAIVAITAFYFGLLMPFGGVIEAMAIAVFGGIFSISLILAYRAIRRGEVALHRQWMIRACAIALGIATIRIISGILDIALAPSGYDVRQIFLMSIWSGWPLMLVAAEMWIRATTPLPRSGIAPASHPA